METEIDFAASKEMNKYFSDMYTQLLKEHEIATKARKKGYDPENRVDILIAKDIADRVEKLLAAVDPNILDKGLKERLRELSKEYGEGDWRVVLKAGEEVSKGKFGDFGSLEKNLEMAVRVGVAYITMGVTAAPLEGFVELRLKERRDEGKYIALYFAGPIRAAGATAMIVSLLIADYLRIVHNLKKYDPTEQEIERYKVELREYNDRVARLQYFPTGEETEMLIKNVPVEINGDATSNREVPNYKNLPRVETNKIRGGMCLVLGEGLGGKSKKMVKNVEEWGKDFGLDGWFFIKDFLKLQQQLFAKNSSGDEEKSKEKILPVYRYLEEAVAGRPIFSYPMAKGGFRLRYGRTRLSGLGCAAVHPMTMFVMNSFIATGCQLKAERPGKACAISPCGSVEPPVVLLEDGEVLKVSTKKLFEDNKHKIKKIIFNGDILFNYGDFLENNQRLPPSPYVEEWWVQELEQATNSKGIDKLKDVVGDWEKLFKNVFDFEITGEQAIQISKDYEVPLYPKYLFFWGDLEKEELKDFFIHLKKEDFKDTGVIKNREIKKFLEKIKLPHKIVNEEIVLDKEYLLPFYVSVEKIFTSSVDEIKNLECSVLELINKFSSIELKNKSGVYVGARMGRPEKAKLRKLKGRPQVLFPVGEQGGRMRSLQEAYARGFVETDVPYHWCENCKKFSDTKKCSCGQKTEYKYYCFRCKRTMDGEICDCGSKNRFYSLKKLNVKELFDKAINNLNVAKPPLIKGVRSVANKTRVHEPIEKGILRAINKLYVNKDGTIRYDAIELPITHFTPVEISAPVEKLKSLGYTKDIEGKDLVDKHQILELKPQDLVLPGLDGWEDANSSKEIFRIMNFLDDLLEKYYGLPRYYNINKFEDMIGQLVIGIAPHTSGGTLGRIIGFSKTQGYFAHPYFHSACRRNCVHPTTNLIVYDKENKKVLSQQIGSLVEDLVKEGAQTKKQDDFLFVKSPDTWEVFSINPKNHEIESKKIKYFLKGNVPKKWVKIKTVLGREFTMTPDHTFLYMEGEEFLSKSAEQVNVGDRVPLSFRFNPPKTNKKTLNLIEEFLKIKNPQIKKETRIKHAEDYFKNVVRKVTIKKIRTLIPFSKSHDKTLSSWYKSVPLSHLEILIKNNICSLNDLPQSTRVSIGQTEIGSKVELSKEFMRLIGYYVSEGHARENKSTHQVSFRMCNQEVFLDLVKCIKKVFGVNPDISENSTKVSISNKIIYYIFTEILKTGKTAKTKRVPSLLFNLDKGLLSYFISAYFDGNGGVSLSPLRLQFCSTSQELLDDIGVILSRYGVLSRYSEVLPGLPGEKIIPHYKKLNKEPKEFCLRHLTLGELDVVKFSNICKPTDKVKAERIRAISKTVLLNEERFTKFDGRMIAIKEHCDFTTDIVKSVEEIKENKNSYCLDIFSDNDITSKNVLWGNQLYQIRCDGDELSFIVLLDGFLNFSRQYLPDVRGGRVMDAPLVLTTYIDPNEIDSEAHNVDVAWKYPLEFYEKTQDAIYPHETSVDIVKNHLGKETQLEKMGYTHPVASINDGVTISAYKELDDMLLKITQEMDLAEKIESVPTEEVAIAIIEKHFMRDLRGNLRQYSMQTFRCVSCNTIYRRIPISGVCHACKGKLLLTVTEGSITKYLPHCISLSEKYHLGDYIKEQIEILKRRIEFLFGKEPTKQVSLDGFIKPQ